MIKAGVLKPADENMPSTKYRRFLEFRDCENISVSDVTLFNSMSWQVVPIHCRNVLLKNIKVISDNGGDDGTDIVRCKKVLIEDCFYRTKDDCIALKSTFDYPESEGIDSVTIRNSVFWNARWGNGIEIGFELNSTTVKNVIFRDLDIIHVESGAAISIHNAGRSHVRDILFDNIRIEDIRQKLFDFAIFRSQYSEDGSRDPEVNKRLYLNGAWDGVLSIPPNEREAHAKYRGSISNVILRNIKVIDGLFPFSIFYGYDKTHNVKNISIENLTVRGQRIRSKSEARIYEENTANITVK
jgi:hypothetical protein